MDSYCVRTPGVKEKHHVGKEKDGVSVNGFSKKENFYI